MPSVKTVMMEETTLLVTKLNLTSKYSVFYLVKCDAVSLNTLGSFASSQPLESYRVENSFTASEYFYKCAITWKAPSPIFNDAWMFSSIL